MTQITRIRVLLTRLVGTFRRRPHEDRLSEEVQAHLDLLTDEHVAAGMSPVDARLAARKAFGGVDQIKERYRDQRGLPALDAFLQDLRFAFRLMRKNTGFSLVAAGSLAMSIGAITIAFSAVNTFVWRPLPIRDPGSVFSFQSAVLNWSYPDYRDIRDRNDALEALIAYRLAMMNVGLPGESSIVWGYLASGNFFDALGVTPAAGRFFRQQEDVQPGAAAVVVLSYELWQSRFGGRTDIAGRSLDINGRPYTIVGVAPAGFHGTEAFYRPNLFVPLMMHREIEAGSDWITQRGSNNLIVAARIKAGLTRAEAEARLGATVATLNQEFTNRTRPLSVTLTRPGFFGDMLGGPARAFAWGLFGLGALLLLTSCFNLVGLLLARSTDRAREIALRAALGAGRGRIARQLMTESLTLAAFGGVGGLWLAWMGTRLLGRLRLPIEIPIQIDLSAPLVISVFAFAISLLVGLLVGLAPARFAGRVDLSTAFKSPASFAIGRHRLHTRDVLVGAQVALCVVLLHACFQSMRGLQQIAVTSIGWNPDGLILASTDLGLAGYDKSKGETLQRRLLDEARGLPGVESAAIGNSLPLYADRSTNAVFREAVQPDDHPEVASVYQVSTGYFRTLQIPLRFGRDFGAGDTADAPQVAIVNRALAEHLFGRSDAVGQRVRLGRMGAPLEIVGVVEDGKYLALGEPRSPAVFRPTSQWYTRSTMVFARVAPGAGMSANDLRRLLLRLDPSLPIRIAATGDDITAFPLFPYRTAVASLGVLGLIASGLLLTGLHALMAYAASRRQREIGVHLALGAGRGTIARLVLTRAAIILGAGCAAGTLITFATGPLLSSLVLGASPRDPLLLGGIVIALAIIVFASSVGPVRRSLRVTPIAALRED